DFAGEERFRFLLSDYTRGADAIIMGFDLSRPITLFHLDNWMNVLKEGETYKNNVPIYLIGTKKDIIDEENNLVDYGYIEEWVKNHNIIEFIETSSKTGENVNKLFLTIAKHIVEYNEKIN
ncbi:MAG: GTP-binding protein, partial [archaeon]|nr:GTP-binding protein [archaeon]